MLTIQYDTLKVYHNLWLYGEKYLATKFQKIHLDGNDNIDSRLNQRKHCENWR